MSEKEDEASSKPEEKDDKKTTIDDWMIRISFAEAGEPDLGFKETGLDILRKTKLALDKIMVVRSEKMSERGEQKMETAGEGPARDMQGKCRFTALCNAVFHHHRTPAWKCCAVHCTL